MVARAVHRPGGSAMHISKMLGATMVAGAIATGGAAAGIAGASASPGGTGNSDATSGSGSEGPVASTSTTPATPSPAPKGAAPKSRSQGKHNCPNMGSSSGAGSQAGPNTGSGYR